MLRVFIQKLLGKLRTKLLPIPPAQIFMDPNIQGIHISELQINIMTYLSVIIYLEKEESLIYLL